MIFHAAYQLNPDSVSASAIRPIRMKQAFQEAGYEVFDLTGTSGQRRAKFKQLKKLLAAGAVFDFLYSESATIPPMIGDPSHFPHLFLDCAIFRTLHAKGIPQAVFYRDVYWIFDDYVQRVGKVLATAMRWLYRAELVLYNRYMDTVYIPSKEMGKFLPQLKRPTLVQLPPGGDIINIKIPHTGLELFYIGGIGAHYDLRNLFVAIAQLPQVHLTVCTAPERWELEKSRYPSATATNINVVHKSGAERDALYGGADVCTIAVAPQFYWDFAVPVKLYEYIGRGKPIIATRNTFVGRFVATHGIGWLTDNSPEDLQRVITELVAHPEEIEAKRQAVLALQESNTWEARARQVAWDMKDCIPARKE